MTKQEDLAAISHEIRTPLNGVLGMIELLRLTNLDGDQKRLIDSAAASGRMLQGLLADVMEFSRLESHPAPLNKAVFLPARLTRDVCALLSRDAAERGIVLERHVMPCVPDALLGDPLRIQQVLINLAANAIKFTERGFVRVCVDARVRSGQCFLQISVEDSGVGIPADQLDRIFEPYQQAHHGERAAPGQQRGVGLGLAITRRLVELMRGEVAVESHPGIGTTFRVSLPLEMPDETVTDISSLENLSTHVASHPRNSFSRSRSARQIEPPFEAASSLDRHSERPPLHALIADDNPINRLLLERQLQKLGCQVSVSTRGDEALELWVSRRPDLLFADCYMPGLDGLDLVRAIREKESEAAAGRAKARIEAFLVSAAFSPAIATEAIAAGFDGFLPKPYSLSDLARIIDGVRERTPLDCPPSLDVPSCALGA
ncbi:MAG: response regulator [Bryobacterales bacterium]|nr:response regulator [Bryobacterales bacterium]